jgi:hypothetical protein
MILRVLCGVSVANANALMLRELVIHHPGYLPIKSASALILRELVLHLRLIPNSSGRRRSSLRVGDLSSEHITRTQRMLVLLPLRELVLCLLFTIMLSSNHNIVRVLSTSLFAMLTGGGLRGTLRLSTLHPCSARRSEPRSQKCSEGQEDTYGFS